MTSYNNHYLTINLENIYLWLNLYVFVSDLVACFLGVVFFKSVRMSELRAWLLCGWDLTIQQKKPIICRNGITAGTGRIQQRETSEEYFLLLPVLVQVICVGNKGKEKTNK